MGGSDQWGNIVNGIDLGRRMMNAQLFALTSPLITTSSGAKMGKTAAGAVWLNADLVSPYDYWQYWRNTEDGDVARFLKLFTVLPLDEIARLAALEGPGDQRGQEGARHRSDRAGAWPRGGRAGRRNRAQDLRGRRARRDAADRVGRRAKISTRASACSIAFVDRRPCRLQRRSAPRHRQQRDLRSTTSASPATRRMIGEKDLTPEGVIKLSLGKKRHVLLRPEYARSALLALIDARAAE